MQNKQIIDSKVISDLSEREKNDPGLINDLITIFTETTPSQVQELLLAFNNNDLSNIIYLSHTLKSSCRSLGALDLANDFEKIEYAGKSGTITNDILLIKEQLLSNHLLVIENLKKITM